MVLLGLVVFTTGCKKDDVSDSLNGTTWKETTTDPGDESSNILTFQQSTFTMTFTMTINSDTISASIDGTYIYNSPNVTLTISDSGEVNTLTGTVSGNQMILTDVDDSNVLIFTKQ